MHYVQAVSAILGLLEVLLPKLRQMKNDGEVSAEEQAELQARLEKLKIGEVFEGEHWKKSDGTPSKSQEPK